MKDTTLRSLINYRDSGIPVGNFLHAVLSNKLVQAISLADPENLRDIKEITEWVYMEMPIDAWGNELKVSDWVEAYRRVREMAKQNKRWPWSLTRDVTEEDFQTKEGEDGRISEG